MAGRGPFDDNSWNRRRSRKSYHVVNMNDSASTTDGTTAETTTSCWRWIGSLVDVEEHANTSADNLKLFDAVKHKKLDKCRKILKEGKTDVNTQDTTTKRTALHLAACLDKSEILELLLKHNASCNVQDSSGNTPLHLAIEKKCRNCCEAILKEDNLHVNLMNKEHNTPLQLAANNGLHDIVEKLLRQNANCNTSNMSGNTPLHLAASKGYQKVAKIFTTKGIIIDAENEDKNTPLHLAAKGGHSELVELLIRCHADVNRENSLGETPIHMAITGGHLSCFLKLLEDPIHLNINSAKKDSNTLLHCAANTGNPGIVKELLKHGANCNAKNNLEDTPLHLAVTKGHVKCCEKLLARNDIKVNEENKNKETPLHQAASVGCMEVCHLLLNHPNIEKDIQNKRKQTPLHLAAKNSNDDVVDLLLKKGAKWKIRDSQSYMPLHYAAENGSEKSCRHLVRVYIEEENRIKSTLQDEQTPLMLAAKKGHRRCCKELFSIDDINATDKYGNSALLYATEGGFLETVSFLIENGANVTTINEEGRTVLHQAARAKADECLKELMKNEGIEILLSKKDKKYGFTPLHEAIRCEACTCGKILLDSGASLWEKCKEGMTPLHLAAKIRGNIDICSLLRYDKGKMNMGNKDNQTALHVAAMNGCRKACRDLLMTNGIHILAKDKNGHTALHLAAMKGHDRVIELLMKTRVSIDKEVADDGSTALHMAARHGHLKCCQVLVATSRRLILREDLKEKLPVDVAFEAKHDKVFAFLMKNIRPFEEDFTNKSSKNYRWASCFHRYMHQALYAGEPRLIAAEAIIDSEWWEAAFISPKKGNSTESNQYCNNFQELIKYYPNLALKAQNRCIQYNADNKISHDFRLFEDISCPEEGVVEVKTPVLTDSQRLLEEHPLSLMVKHNRAELLQHPLVEELLIHLWRTYLAYIYIFLLIIEVLFLASLSSFLANTDTVKSVENKCNSSYELLHEFQAISPKGLERVLNNNRDTTLLPNDEMENFSKCENVVSSNFGHWLFLLLMTTVILVMEFIYIYRLWAWYLTSKRLLRGFQVLCTIILLPGMCGALYQKWIWNTWQWHCGIIGLLLEWLLFISMLNQLPRLFVFMPITKSFFWNYMKALGYILLLLFAFSHIFHLLLAEQTAFQSLFRSLMKMIVWLLGDLNYDDTFNDTMVYPVMGKLIFVMFLIVIFGYIANLAVTQPSERLDEFRKGAAFFLRESQSTLFLEMRVCFPSLWEMNKKRFHRTNFLAALGDRLAKEVMRNDITQEKKLPQEDTQKILEQQVSTLVNLCTEQAEELKDLKDKIDALFRRLPEPKTH